MSTTERAVSTFTEYRSWLEQYNFDGGFDLTTYVAPRGRQEARTAGGHDVVPREIRYAHRLHKRTTCRHCRTPLHPPKDDVDSIVVTEPFTARHEEFSNIHVRVCGECGWWFLYRLSGWRMEEHQAGVYKTGTAEGILRRFAIVSEDLPLDALRRHLSDHPLDVHLVHPRKFEVLVQSIYRDFYQCEVRHVGGPGDNGVDLWAVIRDEPTIIQTKRHARIGYVESVALVRELVGAVILSGAKHGHLVTTATTFSPAAVRRSQSPFLREYGVEISLKARDELYAMLLISNNRLKDIWDSIDFDHVA